MKQLFFFLFALPMFCMAQFDDRFYFPQKEWESVADSISFKEHFIKVEKGVKLNGILLEPTSKSKGQVLFLHGAGGNVTRYLKMTVPLVNHGYSVFMVDFRGYGKSPGTPTHLNIEQDAPKVFDYVSGLKDFEGKRLIVYGASMGTQAAAILARERANSIKLLILDGSIASFTDIAVDSAPEEQKAMIQSFLKSPYSLKEIIKHTEGLKKWIIHSKEDSGVPYQHGLTVFENAAEPKSMWTYEGEHLEAIIDYEVEFFERLSQCLNRQKIPPIEEGSPKK